MKVTYDGYMTNPGGDVYLIQDTCRGLVKIGVSTNVQTRLKGLRAASPCALGKAVVIHGFGIAGERALHGFASDYRDHSEWFRFEGDLVELYSLVDRAAPATIMGDIDRFLRAVSHRKGLKLIHGPDREIERLLLTGQPESETA